MWSCYSKNPVPLIPALREHAFLTNTIAVSGLHKEFFCVCTCVHFPTDNICRCRLAITCIELYSSVEADAILWIVITIARRMTKPFKQGSSLKGKVF